MFRFIDLFAGCGGLSLGLEQAGFHPVYVNELNKDALNTYLVNRSEYKHLSLKEFHSNDIKELTGSKKSLSKLSKNLSLKIENCFLPWGTLSAMVQPLMIHILSL